MNGDISIEICCGSYEDVVEAKKAGANRVELNSALFLGGLTPSLGTLIMCKKNVDIKIISMVRPRAAGFYYSDFDYEVMKQDAKLFIENGTDGLAFGFLNADGTIDKKRTEEFIKISGNIDTVFHRAFDVTPDPFIAMEELISLGVKRILTSGQEPSAIEGQDLIKELIKKANGRIEILPGGGIRKNNIKNFIDYTGVNQVHFSANSSRVEPSIGNNTKIHFGGVLYPREDIISCTNANTAKDIINNIK